MPRGVPTSGKRQPRAFPAGSSAETSLAGSAGDDTAAWLDAPAVEEEMVVLAEADSVSFDEVQEHPEQRADPEPLAVPAEPVLTAEQREIKNLRDQLAKMSGKKDVLPTVDELSRPGDDGNILIHFLEDGFSALGKVWYRGQELEFEVGSQAYKDTFNRNGVSWLDFRHDEFGQVDRFGKIMFRSGPWPGKTYAAGTYEPLKEIGGSGSVKQPSAAEIEAAEKARKLRAAPKLAPLTS